MLQCEFSPDRDFPLVLTVPGLDSSGAAHWQTAWEQGRGDCERVDLGMWHAPRRNAWVTKLDQAIRRAGRPVVLCAHSLGCLAVAWWGALEGQPWGWPVAGALLVAPPDCERSDACATIGGFGPAPHQLLLFPSIVVASRDDPWCEIERARGMAGFWGSEFVDAGELSHINADSGLGAWGLGQALLDGLIAGTGAGSIAPEPQPFALTAELAARERVAERGW